MGTALGPPWVPRQGARGQSPGSSDVFSTVMHYIDSEKKLNMEEKPWQDKVTPTPPPPHMEIVSHQIYTDPKNDQIWSLMGWFQPTGWDIGTLHKHVSRHVQFDPMTRFFNQLPQQIKHFSYYSNLLWRRFTARSSFNFFVHVTRLPVKFVITTLKDSKTQMSLKFQAQA